MLAINEIIVVDKRYKGNVVIPKTDGVNSVNKIRL